jgi:hypothetical protein
MPLVRSYACEACSARVTVHDGAPVPEHCGVPMKWRQTRDYHPELHGKLTGERSAAIGFRHTSPWEIPVQDGSGDQLRMESLRDVRRLESESAKMAADGIGQEMRFRAFNNDTKNGGMLVNSFGEPPQRAPVLTDSQGRQKITFDAVDGEPVEAEMGPGADESLASALGPGMADT